MSDKLRLKLGVSVFNDKVTISLADYGMTKEDYNKMTDEQKESWLYENVVINFEPPSLFLDSFKEVD